VGLFLLSVGALKHIQVMVADVDPGGIFCLIMIRGYLQD
jgi:hypothetical protein